jgi:hypothetical protein
VTPDVAAAFAKFPDDVRTRLLDVRALIYQTAHETQGVGDIVETLKWAQPSYETVRPKSGTPIRLGVAKDQRPALFVHCQTTLIAEFRDLYENVFDFEGNRALVFGADPGANRDALAMCIRRALTYRLRNR